MLSEKNRGGLFSKITTPDAIDRDHHPTDCSMAVKQVLHARYLCLFPRIRDYEIMRLKNHWGDTRKKIHATFVFSLYFFRSILLRNRLVSFFGCGLFPEKVLLVLLSPLRFFLIVFRIWNKTRTILSIHAPIAKYLSLYLGQCDRRLTSSLLRDDDR